MATAGGRAEGGPTGLLATALDVAASALEEASAELNRLDGYAGDGDLGVTMTEVARVVRQIVGEDGQSSDAGLLCACGAAIAANAPSTSGTLVATGLLRAAKVLGGEGPAGGGPEAPAGGGPEAPAAPTATAVLAACFAAALAGVQARGKASVGDRTLVDGLDAVCTSLQASAGKGEEWRSALSEAAVEARLAAEVTANMEPKAGRASWVPQRAMGHRDAGCAMLAAVLLAVAAHFGWA